MNYLRIAKLSVIILCSLLLIENAHTQIKIAASSDALEIKKINTPVFDGKLNDQEWINATLLDFNFTFKNGESHRAKVCLGHNTTHFFVGAILFNVGPNPYTVPDKVTRPDGFFIYFDVDNDGELTSPEDGKGLLNFIGIYHEQIFWSQSISKDYFWDPTEYPSALQSWREARPEIEGKILWDDDINAGVYYGESYDVSTHGIGSYSDGLIGDEHFEFCFSLNSNDTFADRIHLKTGEVKILGFALEFYRQGYYLENSTRVPDLYDFWPSEGFTPNVMINASEYAKMSIDLRTQNSSLDLRIILTVIATVLIFVILTVIFYVKFKRLSKNLNTTLCDKRE